MKRSLILMLVISLLVVTAACTHATQMAAAAPVVTPALKQFEPLPGLYTAGQLAASDWETFAADGVTTVVNLRAAGELAGRDEAAEVLAAGMRYVVIPVASADDINDANAKLLHEALGAAHGKVLVHCASSNRAGALLALEQVRFAGLPASAAPAFARKAGMTRLGARLNQVLGLEQEK